MTLDPDTCWRALSARDARFDGLFFVGVSTTGIYCRPVCRARTPGRDRCAFFRTAAEAERDGFRACFRCRPELAPGGAPVDALPRLVQRALARIAAGDLDLRPVGALAAELGVGDRHLRRTMAAALGVGPLEVAQTRRLAVAKGLLQDTALPLADVAFASGFASLRRFNALFRARFGRPPSAVRREHGAAAARGTLALRLDFRPPLDWDALAGFLALRIIPGVEAIAGGAYLRTVRLGEARGFIAARPEPGRPALRVEVSASLAGAIATVAARVRALADLDAHPAAIDAHLGRDRRLAAGVARHPGLRVPGAFDPFEVVVRAVLGQQVSVRGASTLAGRLVERFGEPIATPVPALRRVFPSAEVLAAAPERDLAAIGLPGARARTILEVARAVARGALSLDRHGDPEAAIARLREIPGIGEWTAQYVALRALGWPDAFPAGDLGLRAALGGSERDVLRRAERWRPWRAYAALHLWTGLGEDRRPSPSPSEKRS